MDALSLAQQHVSALDVLGDADWRPASALSSSRVQVVGNALDNRFCIDAPAEGAGITINCKGASNCRVYIGEGLRGELTINLCGDDALVFVGRGCELNQLEIRSRQQGDLVAVGDGVIVTGQGTWVSGLRAGGSKPALIVGDCCVIGRDVLLRNTDGHPILARETLEPRNTPRRHLLIEPHVWLGERSAVLKDVTIGAFAIVGLGAVVTRDIPRFATAIGNPAQSRVRDDRFWAADDSPEGIARAKRYLARYG